MTNIVRKPTTVSDAMPVLFTRQPPAADDRRADRRYRTVYRIAPAATDRDYGLARIRNISDGGAALEVGFPTWLGDRVTVTLADNAILHGTVVWTNNGECGLRFDQPIDSVALLRDTAEASRSPSHRAPRLPVSRKAVAACERGLRAVEVCDVSQRGMKLVHDGSFAPGLHVKVTLASGIERRGVVRWTQDKYAGVLLTEPFTPQELGAVSAL